MKHEIASFTVFVCLRMEMFRELLEEKDRVGPM